MKKHIQTLTENQKNEVLSLAKEQNKPVCFYVDEQQTVQLFEYPVYVSKKEANQHQAIHTGTALSDGSFEPSYMIQTII